MPLSKCVISGIEVKKIGGYDHISPSSDKFDESVDGVSTHVGVIHKSNMSNYQRSIPARHTDLRIRDPRDATREAIWMLTDREIISKQEHNRSLT